MTGPSATAPMSPGPAAAPPPCVALVLNDLEAWTIGDLLQRNGVAPLVLPLSTVGPQRVHALLSAVGRGAAGGTSEVATEAPGTGVPPRILTLEMPDPDLERALAAAGAEVVPIDHHLVFDARTRRLDDRLAPLSSLEQISDLFGFGGDLHPWHHAVTANDRGFWPELWGYLIGDGKGLVQATAQQAAAPEEADDLRARVEIPGWLAEVLRHLETQDWVSILHPDAEQSGFASIRPVLRVALAVRVAELATTGMAAGGRDHDRMTRFPWGEDDAPVKATLKTLAGALAWLRDQRSSPEDGEGPPPSAALPLPAYAEITDDRGDENHDLILVCPPAEFDAVILDAIHLDRLHRRPDLGAAPVRVLSLLLEDRGPGAALDGSHRPTRMLYSGTAEDRNLINELCRRIGAQGREDPTFEELGRLSILAGISTRTCLMKAHLGAFGSRDQLESLVKTLLTSVLHANRPVTRWTTHFMQVLDWCPDTMDPKDTRRSLTITDRTAECYEVHIAGAQERAYLLPHLRPFFCPSAEDDTPVVSDVDPADVRAPGPSASAARDRGMKGRPVTVGDTIIPGDLRIRSFRRKAVDAVLTVTREKVALFTVAIKEITVHFCYDGLVVLEWVVEERTDVADTGCLWQDLLRWQQHLQRRARTVATLGRLLDFNYYARPIYSPYSAPENSWEIKLTWNNNCLKSSYCSKHLFRTSLETEYPESGGWFYGLVEHVFEPFSKDPKCHNPLLPQDLRIMEDERSRVITGCALLGSPPTLNDAVERLEQSLARAVDVAAFGTGRPYNASFSEATLNTLAYRRFGHFGTLYAIDDHAFVMLGFGTVPHDTLIDHVDTMYRRLFLIGHLYRCIFHKFSRTISTLSQQKLRSLEGAGQLSQKTGVNFTQISADDFYDRAHDIKVRFLGFANALWFDQVSSQMQAIDLFTKLTERLQLKAQYEEMMSEIERTDAIEADHKQAEDEKQADNLSVLGGVFGGALISIDIIGVIMPEDPCSNRVLLGLSLLFGYLAAVLILKSRNPGKTFCWSLKEFWIIARRLLKTERQ